ncbi:MAG: DUF4091 domain-containing protein [Deltaproteobacteria bacterium]|nr:DUF4091 domain-containing protein [Deltaproteobacteria bacterium]
MSKQHVKPAVLTRCMGLLAGLSALAVPAAAQATAVWATHATVKVRPSDAPGANTSVQISAARNEFEPFQVVVQGAATGVQATASALTGPGTIPASNIAIYREALYNATQASGPDGATGQWPDGLVPDVDAYAHEKRNAFPFDVAAGQEQALWVDVFVPPDTPPGSYTGTVTVTGSGIPNGTVDVPVTLTVHQFTLPSTPSLKTAFGMWWGGPCAAEYGDSSCGGNTAELESLRSLYVQAALDHRISIEGAVYQGPSGSDWTHFDQVYGPLLDGTAPTKLSGAKLTEVRYQASRDVPTATNWAQHFHAKGWFNQLFDYTCDEPPATCAWSDIPARNSIMKAADPSFRTLVTTSIESSNAQGVTPDINVMVPVVNFLEPKGSANDRSAYDPFLATSGNELWWYQSCMSHGCGAGATDPYWAGWPSYAIDASAIRARAQEWLSFKNNVSAELYYETMMHSATAWTDQFDFGGNGDGTLFYPGQPSVIGGTTHVPVESIRLKLIREGIEDYEYLKMLSDLGDGAWAQQQAAALFPSAGDASSVDPNELYAVREAIAQRIDSHMVQATTSTSTSTSTTGTTGAVTTSTTATGGTTGGGATTTTASTGTTGGSTGSTVTSTSTGGSSGSTGTHVTATVSSTTTGGSTGSTSTATSSKKSGGCGVLGAGPDVLSIVGAIWAMRRRKKKQQ